MNNQKNKANNRNSSLLRRFVGYYRPHRKLFIIDMICAFVISVFNLVYPYVTKEIINNYVPNRLLNMLIVGACLLLGFYILKSVLNFVLQYW